MGGAGESRLGRPGALCPRRFVLQRQHLNPRETTSSEIRPSYGKEKGCTGHSLQEKEGERPENPHIGHAQHPAGPCDGWTDATAQPRGAVPAEDGDRRLTAKRHWDPTVAQHAGGADPRRWPCSGTVGSGSGPQLERVAAWPVTLPSSSACRAAAVRRTRRQRTLRLGRGEPVTGVDCTSPLSSWEVAVSADTSEPVPTAPRSRRWREQEHSPGESGGRSERGRGRLPTVALEKFLCFTETGLS